MINSALKRSQQQNWNSVAPAWDRHFEWYAGCFQPFIAWCCEAAALAPGMRVLDIACGTGLPALAAAARVGPSGSLSAVDISHEMLRAVARRARHDHVQNIDLLEMDAEALGFANQSFDAVTCAFGLMFCPNPAAVLDEIRRVLKPGGKFAISVWDVPANNSFVAVFGRAVADVFSLPRSDRAAPGPFRLANVDEFESLLRAAQFTNVEIAARPLTIAYESLAWYQDSSLALAPAVTTLLNAATPETLRRLGERLQQATVPYWKNGELQFVATPWCASGSAR